MSVHEVLQRVKQLVDDCEVIIRDGRLAVLTRDVNLAERVLEHSKNVIAQTKGVLGEAKRVIEAYDQREDRLYKYVSTYYRMLVMVSMPYAAMVLREVAVILEKHGRGEKAGEARSIAGNFEEASSTLRPQ